MKYTKNQHMLSQWILRNFRSDDSVGYPKDKQRVWCHTVYPSGKENEVRDLSLPISSVGVNKNCFMLIDGESGNKFDIENELSEYELSTSIVFNELVKKHKFQRLLDINRRDNTLVSILNFMVIQMVLGFYNPQNKMEGKDKILSPMLDDMLINYQRIEAIIKNPPSNVKSYYQQPLFQKMLKVVNSESSKAEKCKTLFILSMLAEAKFLPSLFGYLAVVRNSMFAKIYISGIYHTGYDFDSIEKRPVFTVSPNTFIINENNNMNLLPLSHNLCLSFSLKESEYYNDHLKIYSADPSKLNCRSSKRKHIYKVSHDFIDNITAWVCAGNIGHTNTMYTPHSLKDVEDYLNLQNENENFYYSPSVPEFVSI
ncbi:DUF4238 domain-containing protein [Pseudoalteromonas sp.]|uniref:DUF4238 domain-containing protein n=1 Tax=Pseudoalteromonas sp. TaxID=53249 RepID=UPI0023554301|nr:DUF4238 domain-containing protein [Pseudoalteromonas sp.]